MLLTHQPCPILPAGAAGVIRVKLRRLLNPSNRLGSELVLEDMGSAINKARPLACWLVEGYLRWATK